MEPFRRRSVVYFISDSPYKIYGAASECPCRPRLDGRPTSSAVALALQPLLQALENVEHAAALRTLRLVCAQPEVDVNMDGWAGRSPPLLLAVCALDVQVG